jgi:hypothetical protein
MSKEAVARIQYSLSTQGVTPILDDDDDHHHNNNNNNNNRI